MKKKIKEQQDKNKSKVTKKLQKITEEKGSIGSISSMGSMGNISIKKQCTKSRPICKVTFKLPNKAAPEAKKVTIVGDFNNWNPKSTPVKRLKNGDFAITLELEKGRDYRFRYLIDDLRWENDWYADRYEPNPYGCDDSVVIV